MTASVVLLMAVLGQAPQTQPAGPPSGQARPFPLGPRRITVATQPATPPRTPVLPLPFLPATRPAIEVRVGPEGATQVAPTTMPAATNLLAGLTGDRVEVEVLADGSIVLRGAPEDVAIWQQFIAQLEAEPGIKPIFRVFRLQNAQAATLADQITRVWNESHRPTIGTARPEDRLNIIPEPRANLLMVATAEKNLPEIAGIIEQLDVPLAEADQPVLFQPIPLKNIKADEAETLLRDMLKDLQQRRGAAAAEPATIRSDMRTNSLLVSASKADFEQIRRLVELIDVPPVPGISAIKLAIFPLKKAVASDLASALTEILTAQPPAGAGQAAAMREQIRRLQMVMMGPEGAKALPDLDLEKQIKVWAEPGTNSVIVATSEENIEPMRAIVEMLDALPLADQIFVRIFPLQYADAETLQTNLRALFDAGPQLPELPDRTQVDDRVPVNPEGQALVYRISTAIDRGTNTLIVAGRTEQLQLVEEIVRKVDVKESAGKYAPRLVQLEHADVKAIADVLQKLVDQRQRLYEAAGPTVALRQAIAIIPDSRTNSLVVVASQENYEEIANLARELDSSPNRFAGQFRIITLENLTAADLATKVRDLWQRQAQLRQAANLPADDPVVVSDARTNSLIVSANPEDVETLVNLVKQLEQQKISPMMEIRTLIIRHNDPTRVADTLRRIFEERLANSRAQGQEEQVSERVAIVDDPLTKTLLIASNKNNYDEIVRLVTQLDVPPTLDSVILTFFIRNANVTKVAEMVRELFTGGVYQGANVPRDIPEALTKVTVVADERSRALIVSASPENLTLIEKLVQQVDQTDMPILTGTAQFFRIENADVLRVADMLDQALEGIQSTLEDPSQLEYTVVADPRTRSLMVAGTRDAIRQAEALIPRLDVAAGVPTAEPRVYRLEQTSARQLAPILTELFEQRERVTGAGQQARTTPVLVQPVEGSNSLIVTASPEDHAFIQDLLKSLDVPSTLAQQMRVFPLSQARAEGLADTLQELLQEQLRGREGAPPVAVTPEPRTNSLIVFAPPDLMNNIGQIIQSLDTTQPVTDMALQVFKLRNAEAEDMAERLREFFQEAAGEREQARRMIITFPAKDPVTGEVVQRRLVYQDVTITPDPATNSLMVLAPRESMDMMAHLIDMLDAVELRTAEVQIFHLLNEDAEEMRRTLEELFEAGAGRGGAGEARTRLALAGGEGAAPAAAPGVEGGITEIAFSTDRRTNSLLAAGSPANLRIVERLVLQLDSREMPDRIVRVVHLKNALADEVADTLESYFEAESQVVEEAAGGAAGEAALRRTERQVTVQSAGETQNTLLLAYSPRLQTQVMNIIEELDLPPPQVMIQVLIAEVTLDNRLEMGMEFALQDLNFSEHSFLNANNVLQGSGFDRIFGVDLGAQGQSGLGGISFTITGEDFNFLVRALQVEGNLEVLSRPAILVQDNQDANINVGSRVPTIQDINISATGFVTPAVTYVDVGVILDVTPIINPDGFVNMTIRPEISSIGASSVTVASGVALPIFDTRSAETSVTVKDGETIIIGGLITNRVSDTENKVPLLGDIPLLGNLFRATVKLNTKTELLMVLTPHVIRDAEEARRISLQMRDQTGILDNVRRSPLMGKLRDAPEDQCGPEGPIPFGPATWPAEEYGPIPEDYGPPVGAVHKGASDSDTATYRIRRPAAEPVVVPARPTR